jgi:hypothetical protein
MLRTRFSSKRVNNPEEATVLRAAIASLVTSLYAQPPFRSVGVHGSKVVSVELRMVGDDLLRGCSAGEPLEDFLNGDPVAADTRLSESHIRIDRNPIKQRTVDCRHLCGPGIIVYRRFDRDFECSMSMAWNILTSGRN